jgi:predicted transcriptional regulator
MKAHEKQNQGFYKERVSRAVGCSENAVQNAIRDGVEKGLIRFVEQGRERVYAVTEKGVQKASERPSPYNWTNQQPETGEN